MAIVRSMAERRAVQPATFTDAAELTGFDLSQFGALAGLVRCVEGGEQWYGKRSSTFCGSCFSLDFAAAALAREHLGLA